MQYKVIIDSIFDFEGLTIDCGTLHHFHFCQTSTKALIYPKL